MNFIYQPCYQLILLGVALRFRTRVPSDVGNYDIGLPFIDEAKSNMPYWAWITIARIGEYEALLKQIGVGPEENLKRLSQTGMLLMRPGSDTSRAFNAPDN